ncbi:ATP-dependent Clp protease ATP-binding subunit ClpC [Nocardia transvalensis]|uniref:ATP-dependent Clp protease ATP-binding subunit ClpC n=1 Tax=Nocardia transvalensis TaxID=37333 RepID=A0A7W9P998_9NOCA|nr:Clp protease N-terminal domain-containing protein [Nocardia transvalensis]MBB5911841.1 ATP-dependent Clp protease ATP-binding subunit ClpC [Nocardia transvalensis]
MTTPDATLTLTPRTNWIFGYAQAVARERGHDHIGPEHIQLAILDNADSVPAQVLSGLGRLPRELAEAVSAAMRADDYEPAATRNRIVGAAGDLARNLGHDHIGVEHLQLALLRNRDSLATRELAGAGVDLDEFENALTEAAGG